MHLRFECPEKEVKRKDKTIARYVISRSAFERRNRDVSQKNVARHEPDVERGSDPVCLCGASGATAPPPQVVKETVVVTQPGPVVKETVQVPVTVAPVKKQIVELWSTDNEEYRIGPMKRWLPILWPRTPMWMCASFPIDEATVSQRIATARGANRLPDIARVGVERVAPFLADGILDVDAATKVVKELGEDTFHKGVLDLVRTSDGKYAAVPFDGWIQALWYRSDAFKKLGLTAPIKWDDIQKGM